MNNKKHKCRACKQELGLFCFAYRGTSKDYGLEFDVKKTESVSEGVNAQCIPQGEHCREMQAKLLKKFGLNWWDLSD